MKKISLLLFFECSILIAAAQTPGWKWAVAETAGTCYMDAHGIGVGQSGNVYIGGRFGGTMTIGGATAISNCSFGYCAQVFSAKFDSSGTFKWVTPHPYSSAGGNDYDYGFAIDNRENNYVTGTCQGSLSGYYIDKYDSSGVLKWALPLSGSSAGYSVSVDKYDNVYTAGSFSGTQSFGNGITITATGSQDMFLAKYDSNGVCKWAVNAGGSGQIDGATGVAADANGYIYVCGSYNGTTTFNAVSTGATTLGNVSSDGFFVAKYDTSGNLSWVQSGSNAGYQSPGYYFWQFNGITVDSCSNVYVTGHFVNSAQFGTFSLTNANSNYDIFVAKCLANGTWEWAKSAGGTSNDEGEGIALDKYSDVYITGYFTTNATFDNQTVNSSASSDIYVAKYANSTGALQWVQSGGGTINTGGNGLGVDKNGYVYVAGGIGDGTATFGPSSIAGITNCGQNIFVAKLDTIAPRQIIPVIAASYCPGSTDTIPYSVIGSFNLGNTFTAQLSDSNGSFANATDIGFVTDTANGKIVITIPAGTPTGSTYLIRVVSSNPATSSWANGCGSYYINNVYPNDFYVTIGGNLAVTLLPINPSTCSGGSIQLIASGGTSYQWSNGATTDTTTVTPTKDTVYSVTVSSGGGCTKDTSIAVTVTASAPLDLTPSTALCGGQSLVLKVTGGNSNYVYTWSPATSLSSSVGDSVTASPTTDVTYTVTGVDTVAGCSGTSSDTISIVPAPNQPTITQHGDTLVSSATTNNQWYRNDTLISGATNQNLIIGNSTAIYTVVVSNPADGCSSASALDTASGINQLSIINSQLSVYPNPTNGNLYINIKSSANDVKDWNLRLTDVLDRTIYTRESLNYNNVIDLSQLAGGVYFITVTSKTAQGVFKIVKQ